MTPSRESPILYLVSAALFTTWQIFTAFHIQMDNAAVRQLLARYSDHPELSTWTGFALRYGSFAWLMPLASVALVTAALYWRWRTTAQAISLFSIGVLAFWAHVVLTQGLYTPVVWFMNKVL